MISEAVTPLGAVIAVGYVAAISSILWWMLHIPAAGGVEQHVARVAREESKFKRIVVPVQGDALSDRLIALASQMARFRGARMDVLYIVEVPFQFPISAISSEQRERADETFEREERIARKYDVGVSRHIESARQAGPAIVRYATETGTDLLMMADVPKQNRRGTQYARSVEYVFENAPFEVILDRPAMVE